MERGAWRATVHGVAESDTTKGLSTLAPRGHHLQRPELKDWAEQTGQGALERQLLDRDASEPGTQCLGPSGEK